MSLDAQLRADLDDLRAESARRLAEVERLSEQLHEAELGEAEQARRADIAEARLSLVRAEVNERSLNAVAEPPTEDQATMAGRYHVCVFLLRNVLAHLAGRAVPNARQSRAGAPVARP